VRAIELASSAYIEGKRYLEDYANLAEHQTDPSTFMQIDGHHTTPIIFQSVDRSTGFAEFSGSKEDGTP
jgi:hypothetical protein